jgi:hypothetical protein
MAVDSRQKRGLYYTKLSHTVTLINVHTILCSIHLYKPHKICFVLSLSLSGATAQLGIRPPRFAVAKLHTIRHARAHTQPAELL